MALIKQHAVARPASGTAPHQCLYSQLCALDKMENIMQIGSGFNPHVFARVAVVAVACIVFASLLAATPAVAATDDSGNDFVTV